MKRQRQSEAEAALDYVVGMWRVEHTMQITQTKDMIQTHTYTHTRTYIYIHLYIYRYMTRLLNPAAKLVAVECGLWLGQSPQELILSLSLSLSLPLSLSMCVCG